MNLTEKQWNRGATGRISSYFLRNVLKSFAKETIKWQYLLYVQQVIEDFQVLLPLKQKAEKFDCITLLNIKYVKSVVVFTIQVKKVRMQPVLVARLAACLTGDQEVAGSSLIGSATFFHRDWSWNILYGYSLPSADSRRSLVSFWQKNVYTTG